MVEPSESAFDNPTSWKDSEALLVIRTQDNLKMKATIISHPLQELAAITTVHPDEPQLLAGAAQVRKQETGSIPVLGSNIEQMLYNQGETQINIRRLK